MTASTGIRMVALPSGERIAALGQGTWYLGENPATRAAEIAALRTGLDLGLTVVDTAEMYGQGASEILVGEALAGRRDEVFLVDKVLPQHATHDGTIGACEASLRRLGTDRIDLYLLHWRGAVPIAETVSAFDHLVRAGSIRYWGVSNFDLAAMAELLRVPGGAHVQTDQVLYNLTRRGIEWDLLPWAQTTGLPIMAYSPIEQGRLVGHPVLRGIAARLRATTAQVALRWVIQHEGVNAIPRAGTPDHVRANRAALDIELGPDEMLELDSAFPPPSGPVPLEVL